MAQRRRARWLLIAALLLAAATALLAYSYVTSLERQLGERATVLVVAKDITPSTLIVPDMVGRAQVPLQYLREYAPSYIAAGDGADADASIATLLTSEQLITAVTLKKGSVLQRDLLYSASQIARGMRAVAIGVTPVTSVGGSVRAGSRVDIVVSLKEEAGATQAGKSRTVMLLQDVLVLAVGTADGQRGAASGIPVVGGLLPSGEMAKSVTVTVALPPEDATRLVYMDNFAKEVRLVLRRADDRDRPRIEPVTGDSFGTP